ncbi:siderophore-interacting protein [Pseudonocardia sp. CA-107938]|uniref:siderophore-interacting protein n=1 Tax=Pseudonocardia sp. CA-107938 TaxID=3240021 RepID=UPI003D8BF53A
MDDPLELVVAEVATVSPSLVRVELTGPDIARYTPLGLSDEAAVLHLPLPDGEPDPSGRWYTIRDVVEGPAGRLAVELVTHDGGVGASWARRARPGDRVVVSTRRGWFRRPADATWQILLGDVAALPAISRIVAETPAGMRTAAVVEVPDPADARELPGADTTWVHRPDQASGSGLPELARDLLADLPDGRGYVYVAGEAAATRAVRRMLRHELGLPPSAYGVIGYWRIDAERWNRRYEQSVDTYQRIWAAAESSGRDDEEVLDIYEARLAEAGLL